VAQTVSVSECAQASQGLATTRVQAEEIIGERKIDVLSENE
jgi:hypothetical protein